MQCFLKFSDYLLKLFLNYFFPQRCLICYCFIQNDMPGLCPDCWLKINFITLPMCQRCGRPLPYDCGDNIICIKCYYNAPNYNILRALLIFNENSKSLIYAFKYYDRSSVACVLAQLLYTRYKHEIAIADYIIPVPIHKIKRLLRGYNQTQILGKYLSNISKLPLRSDILLKHKWTKSQTSLTKKNRAKNIKGSFKVCKPQELKNKKVILLDDVITTGATIDVCTKLLKESGVQNITVLCVAST